MKYLKKFENRASYNEARQNLILPNVSLCVSENEVHYNPWTYAEAYLTFVAKESGTFTFTPQNSNVISYSTDGGETWTEGNSIEVNNGDKVMWKGTMTPSYQGIGTFSATGNFDVQGNVMSLLYGDNFKGQTDLTGKNYAFYELFKNNTKMVSAENLSLSATTLANNCYEYMFYGCTSLTTAPALLATTLAEYCYHDMFRGCTSLTIAPELPATTLRNYCYGAMFYGCTGLVTAPVLSATTLAESCYDSMFGGCTNLKTAPVLPATTLARGCYQAMFEGCTSLVTAPELPARPLASYCYGGMFRGCTNLVIAPKLPVTVLAEGCYNGMFHNCTSLTTAPELPATTLRNYCYGAMFYGCTNLSYIKAMFTTTPNTKYVENWVKDVSATGTFVKNSAATWTTTGVNGVPSGWTVVTE